MVSSGRAACARGVLQAASVPVVRWRAAGVPVVSCGQAACARDELRAAWVPVVSWGTGRGLTAYRKALTAIRTAHLSWVSAPRA
ncbi:hypothetical protein Aoc01nite_02720 [Actinoplanes octamycinicus]|nr:hypothetical protein Aoc01nite_02720 [Actinoplanes octamycinicus]